MIEIREIETGNLVKQLKWYGYCLVRVGRYIWCGW